MTNHLYLYWLFIGIKVLTVIWMNVSFFPVQFIFYDLVYVWINESGVIGVRINEMTELKPIIDVHKQTPLSISMGECHLRVQVASLVDWSGRLVCYDRRVDQVAVTDKRHVPQSPETGINVIR
ncbi:hypothetical protein ALC62_01298 [Cyphomyrmex costatus]|uniref:Uncharacterized protein n=1 Tax=Cyphomyrmex costatus TaxID=456900 RepID=A0A195D4I2_9HYME|nr:hypothetical protein ALC62_01298 [Cyphomyrmex costatus]